MTSKSVVDDKLLPPLWRTVVYAIFVTASLILLVVGVLSKGEVLEAIVFATALLSIGGNGLALLNRPKEQ